MGRFVSLNPGEQLDWNLGVREASSCEVRDLELRESLRIELGFQLFQDLCKFYEGRNEISGVISVRLFITHGEQSHLQKPLA